MWNASKEAKHRTITGAVKTVVCVYVCVLLCVGVCVAVCLQLKKLGV